MGITVPHVRQVAQSARHLSFKQLGSFLNSMFHEERMLALLVLTENFREGSDSEKKKIFEFYLKNLRAVNNWDLVDLSAYKIVGVFLEDKSKSILMKLAKSKRMWDRRVAIVSTLHLIRTGHLSTTFKLTEMLLDDAEDLMHKACGWMLREAGKRSRRELEDFLRKNSAKMPRTMLRYAIEKFPEKKRRAYLQVPRVN